jgi:hypothetical protein
VFNPDTPLGRFPNLANNVFRFLIGMLRDKASLQKATFSSVDCGINKGCLLGKSDTFSASRQYPACSMAY